jgi:hypothetical protein
MKKIIFLILILLLLKLNSFSQSKPDTIRAGIYLKSLYDFNSSAFSYDVDFWMWFIYKNDTLKPLQRIEIANAKKYDYSDMSIEKRNGLGWATQNCKATINQNWDLKHYPFDHQKLEIVLEETEHDIRKVILTADNPKFEYNDKIDIKGWKIDSSKIWNGISEYKSDFGDPTLNGMSKYSNVHYTIFLSRESWALFFKLFTGCYVAFLVSFLVFFIKPIYVDPRFGLSIGGLFAAVGNKYVVDSNIPSSISFTLVDKIHDITFVYILLTIFLSIISLKIYDGGKILKQKRFDNYAALSIFISYVLLNTFLIANALR